MINSITDLQVEGTIIVREDTQFPSDKFKYREMVLEVNSSVDGDTSIEYLKMRYLQAATELLEEVRCGYRVLVTFKITNGPKTLKKQFTLPTLKESILKS